MAKRQIPDLPVNSVPADTDIFATRQVSTDKQLTMADLAEFIQRGSAISPTSEILTISTALDVNDLVNKIFCVQTGAVDITITFPAADATHKGIIKAIYNEDTNTGRVIITGDINTDDVYLRSKEVAIFQGAETDTGVFEWVNVKERNITNLLYQDDADTSVLAPTTATLWEFSSPGLMNSAGVIPEKLSEITYIDSLDANAKFSDRGVIYIENGGILVYDHALANQGVIAFRYRPTFAYTTANDKYIIDTRSLSGNTENAFVIFYNAATDQLIVQIFDDGSNWITLSTAAFVSDVSLQVWHDIFINFNTASTADLYLNGAVQGKAISGSGITNADFPQRDKLSIGCQYLNAASVLGADCGEFYFCDLFISSVYSANVSNYNGTGGVLPNFTNNRITTLNHNSVVDEFGNAGYINVDTNTLVAKESIGIGGKIDTTKQLEVGVPDAVADSGVAISNQNGKIEIVNGTATTNTFLPTINFESKGSNSVLLDHTIPTGEDTGTNPAYRIDTSVNGSALTTRPLILIRNNGATKLTLDPDGNLTITGYAVFASKRITATNFIYGTQTHDTVFDALSPFIPNTDDIMMLNGGAVLGGSTIIIGYAKRQTTNTIQIFGITTSGVAVSNGITNGLGTAVEIAASW